MKKKIIILSEMILITTTSIILFSRITPANATPVECEISTNRIMALDNEQLIKEYNEALLKTQKENELEQAEIDEVKNVKITKENTTIKATKVKAKVIKKEKVKSNRWGITLTENEINLLARIVFRESHLEPDAGQQAVTEVIFNRMNHEEFKGSLIEVLSARNQFQSWGTQSTAEPTEKEYDNIQKVLDGESLVLSSQYVYFSTSPRNNNGTVKIGNHYFCQY